MKNKILLLLFVFACNSANAFFFIIPIPNLAKHPELQKLIDAYEKSNETKAVAFVSEDKLFGAKQWVWGHKSGVMTQEDANNMAMRACELSLSNVKSRMAGGQPVNDFGQKRCELYKFANETVMLPPVVMLPVVTAPAEIPKVEESATGKKLKELDSLLNQKLITQEEYEKKRKEILSNL